MFKNIKLKIIKFLLHLLQSNRFIYFCYKIVTKLLHKCQLMDSPLPPGADAETQVTQEAEIGNRLSGM